MMPIYKGKIQELKHTLLKALVGAGVNGQEILTNGIKDFHPIHWMAPPIYPVTEIAGAIPSVFTGSNAFAIHNNLPRVLHAYNEAMLMLKNRPWSVVAKDNSYLPDLSWAFGLSGTAGRAVFSGPAIGAVEASVEAGFTLTLELVAALNAAGKGDLIRGDNEFYILFPDKKVGISKGLPIGYEDLWPLDVSGDLPAYLSMQRGAGWEQHTLDVVDRIYYWLEANPEKMMELDGLTDILSYLRASLVEADLQELEKMVFNLEPAKFKYVEPKVSPKVYFEKIQEAQEVMADIRIPDQLKVARLVEILVPGVLSETAFNSKLWNLHKKVYTMERKHVLKIERALDKLKNKDHLNDVKTY